jgi:hypothetical protein
MIEFNQPKLDGDNIMGDSSLNATEIAVGSLLAGGAGGRGGYGGGAWGGGGSGEGVYASPTANAVRIDAHAAANASGIENLLDQNQFAATNKNIVDGHNRLSDTNAVNVNRVSDNQFRSELRNSDQHNEIIREMNANARIAAECCCDTKVAIAEAAKEAALCCCDAKLEASKSHAEIMATVLAENAKTRELMTGQALDTANAKIIQLETIAALQRGHHG